MNKIIKLITVICIAAEMFVAPVYCQTVNQIEIQVYDGYAYFNSTIHQPIPSAKISYNGTQELTDSLGKVIINVDSGKDTAVFINAPGYEEQKLTLTKFFKNGNKCSIPESVEVFLGYDDAFYGYKDGKRVPFELREGSFSVLISDDNKSAALELIPEEYRTPFKADVTELKDAIFLIVDSVTEQELYKNDLFRKIRGTGAELGPITKDLKMIVSSSLMVQPCGRISAIQLKEEILKTYPELQVNYDPTIFPDRITVTLPQNVCFDMFEWFEKIDKLDFVGRIDLNPLILIRYD